MPADLVGRATLFLVMIAIVAVGFAAHSAIAHEDRVGATGFLTIATMELLAAVVLLSVYRQ